MKTKEDLIAFEAEIAALFNFGIIYAPVHPYFCQRRPDYWCIS